MGALAGGPSERRAKATGPLDTDALVGDRGLWEQPLGAPLTALLPAWHPHPAGHVGSHTHFPGGNAAWTRPGRGADEVLEM